MLGTLPGLVPSDVKARYPIDKTGQINTVLGKNPVLFDHYLSDATEVDVDCLCDGKDVSSPASWSISRRPASIPAIAPVRCRRTRCAGDHRRTEEQTRELALALDVGGLMNVQFAIKDGEIYVLEVNPRASRTVPFVAKAIGVPMAKIAAKVMAGRKPRQLRSEARNGAPYRGQGGGVPLRPLPRRRYGAGAGDALDRRGDGPGPASSTSPSPRASSAAEPVPTWARLFVSVRDVDKMRVLDPVRLLAGLGFKVIATGGTARFLNEHGIAAQRINKVSEGRPTWSTR